MIVLRCVSAVHTSSSQPFSFLDPKKKRDREPLPYPTIEFAEEVSAVHHESNLQNFLRIPMEHLVNWYAEIRSSGTR
jgi:hypothetical protein